MSWVLRHSDATLGDRLVLIVLADHAREDGTSAWPSLETIAQQSKLSERQARRCLRNLEELGEIKETGRSRKGTHIYDFPKYRGGDNMTPDPSLKQPLEEQLPAAAPQNGHITDQPLTVRVTRNMETGGNLSPARAKPPRRTKGEINAIWDSLTDIFGAPTTRSAESLRGKHVQSLAAAGATPDEIMRRARTWPAHFDNATLTPAALEKHWDALGRKPLRRTR